METVERIQHESCKDVSARKYSTTAIVQTPWPSERPAPTSQAVSSATPVSLASLASGSGSSLTIPQHKKGTQQVTDMHLHSEITKEDLHVHSITIMQLSPVVSTGDAAQLLEKKYVTRQVKPENVTAHRLRINSFGDKVNNPQHPQPPPPRMLATW